MSTLNRILLDMDEVLCATRKRWIARYNEDWDDDLSLHKVGGWGIHMWVKPECGKKVYDYLNEPSFFAKLEPNDGAVEGTKQLLDDGFDVVIVTATPKNSFQGFGEKRDWVRRHLPFLPLDNFISAHRKDLIRGDLLLDDGPHNTRGFPGVSVLMSMPGNVGEDCSDFTVDSWYQFIDLIERLKRPEEWEAAKYYSRCRLDGMD